MPRAGPQVSSRPAAAPAGPALTPALSEASRATPAKPMTRPRIREASGRSLSQAQATRAPNKGTVALRMADSPVVRYSRAKAKQAKGRPEFSNPTRNTAFQCWRNSRPWPRISNSGSRNSEAMATRTPAVGSAPNSTTASRVNRKDEPQMAASSTNSANHGRVAGGDPLTGRLRCAAARSCDRARRHSRSASRRPRSPGGRER
ncbi:MAG: hypothetical protein BWX79_02636 [Alphaproteobacteria bacterium ADurb.Bin100]|nr:MAG: hypothetical protein BWX79_02636 [Alphaproteobacteria bacterium ADurb.Bin100]